MLSRRRLLSLAGVALWPGKMPGQGQWLYGSAVEQMRTALEQAMAGHGMALDLRALDAERKELFRIQINADRLLPVASCFKAFIVPWYYLNVPWGEQDDGPGSELWDSTVFSNNLATARLLTQVAGLLPGGGNPIEKFNDFLLAIGMQNGMFTWQVGPTSGLYDLRFRPSAETGRVVSVKDFKYWISNVFTARDLAQGHDFIARGEQYFSGANLERVLQKSRALLGIPDDGFPSPLERVHAPGYIGKHGVVPAWEMPAGLVINDAGILDYGRRQYILSFMSVAVSQLTAIGALRQAVHQVRDLEQVLARHDREPLRLPQVRG